MNSTRCRSQSEPAFGFDYSNSGASESRGSPDSLFGSHLVQAVRALHQVARHTFRGRV